MLSQGFSIAARFTRWTRVAGYDFVSLIKNDLRRKLTWPGLGITAGRLGITGGRAGGPCGLAGSAVAFGRTVGAGVGLGLARLTICSPKVAFFGTTVSTLLNRLTPALGSTNRPNQTSVPG